MAKVTDTVRMALAKNGQKMKYLDDHWFEGRTSPNVIYNKSMRDSWSARDLIKVARLTGSKLALVFPDGQQIFFDPDAEEKD